MSNVNNQTTEIKELPCQLTQLELADVAREMVQTHHDIAALELEKKTITAEVNAKIKTAKQLETKLAAKHLSGVEVRAVTCKAVYLYDQDLVEWYRTDMDPHVLVGSRPMDAYDKQERLKYDGTGDLPPPKKRQPRTPKKSKGELTEAAPLVADADGVILEAGDPGFEDAVAAAVMHSNLTGEPIAAGNQDEAGETVNERREREAREAREEQALAAAEAEELAATLEAADASNTPTASRDDLAQLETGWAG
jgi:hypothetical protein